MKPGKNVAVLGLGKSGYESAAFLRRRGYRVFVSESGNSEAVLERAGHLKREGIAVETGGHTGKKILQSDWIVISPGIPPSAPVYAAARSKSIPVFSEIEVASWFSCPQNVVAITGTSGKTTVTTLTAAVLNEALRPSGRKAVSCGNVGNPWIGEIGRLNKEDVVVLEVSSFQLAHCETFRPGTGILLNLAANHQDWHPDMQDYVRAKLRLFRNQKPEDFAIVRKPDREKFYPDFRFNAKVIYLDESNLRAAAGKVNPNEEAVRLVGKIFGCDPELTENVLKNFQGIEHRLERFNVSAGVAYVNDSKSTTAASLAWALEKFPDGRVILLAGGHPKSSDFETVRGLVARKVKKAILIGEARPLLREAWRGSCELLEAEDFPSAVGEACRSAAAGDTVLLSPACASFDMFSDYEDRGRRFKEIVREITVSSCHPNL